MSVYRRMFGRELPSSVRELLQVPLLPLSLTDHERLTRLATLGLADSQSLYRLGLSHLSRGEPGLARKHLARAVLHRPTSTAALLPLAAACEMIGLHDQAAEHLESALAQTNADPDSPAHYLRLLCAAGFARERAGQWRRAIAIYEKTLAFSAAELFPLHRLIAIRLSQGQLAEAAATLRALLTHQPADQAARACLGHILQATGRPEEAIWEYEQALCLEPDTWELPRTVARELSRAQNTDEALGLLYALIDAGPDFPDLRLRLGNLHSERGEDAAACEQYRHALSLHPDYLECHIALGRHEMRMARATIADEHFRRALAINDQHVELYAALALAYHSTADETQAAEMLQHATQIARNSAVLTAQIGLLELDCDDPANFHPSELPDEWADHLYQYNQSLLEKHPSWDDLTLHQGLLLNLMGRRDQTFATLREAVMADPTNAKAWLHLALVLNDMTRPEDAHNALATALALDQRSAALHYRLGLVFCGQLEFDLAIEKLQNAPGAPMDLERRVWVAAESLQLDPTRTRTRQIAGQTRAARVLA